MKLYTRLLFSCLLWLLNQPPVLAQDAAFVLPKKAAGPLQEDLQLLQKILEANHPSLYWYTPKDSIDLYFKTAINSITDSMDEVQFRNKVASVISTIRCGHTSVRFSKAYAKIATRFRYPQFPLMLKAWGDSLVVLNSQFPNDSIFKRGTIITGINGRNNRQLLDTFFRFISTDGYSNNYKNQAVSSNFAGWYKTIIGLDSVYHISYIDSSGKEAVAVVKNFIPHKDPPTKQPPTALKKPSHKELRKAKLLAKRSLTIDTTSHTAIMNLTTFSSGRLRTFFRRSFKTIQQQNIQNLVIDLRANGGGRVSNSILLSRYLSDHAFKIGDSVVAISRKFKYGRYIHPSWIYWFAMNFGAHKMDDGLIHFRYYEKKFFQPKEANHFNGHVFLVQGGFSFSATTMFISQLKGQSNIKIVGEETGGGYYGNSAMHIPTIRLPNSGLQISLPMYRLVMDANRPKGHGIIPDIAITPSSDAIKRGVDLKMVKIKELIKQNAF
jgi:hypothetical protein